MTVSQAGQHWLQLDPDLGWSERDGFIHTHPEIIALAKEADRVLEEPLRFTLESPEFSSGDFSDLRWIRSELARTWPDSGWMFELLLWLHLTKQGGYTVFLDCESSVRLPASTWWNLHSPSSFREDFISLGLCGFFSRNLEEFLNHTAIHTPTSFDWELIAPKYQMVVVRSKDWS